MHIQGCFSHISEPTFWARSYGKGFESLREIYTKSPQRWFPFLSLSCCIRCITYFKVSQAVWINLFYWIDIRTGTRKNFEYDFCPHREYLVAVSHKVKLSVNWLLCYRFFEALQVFWSTNTVLACLFGVIIINISPTIVITYIHIIRLLKNTREYFQNVKLSIYVDEYI